MNELLNDFKLWLKDNDIITITQDLISDYILGLHYELLDNYDLETTTKLEDEFEFALNQYYFAEV